MAIQRVGIHFDFNANTGKAQANLNALEKTMGRLENRLVGMGARKLDQGIPSAQHNKMQELKMFGETQIDLRTPIRQTDALTDSIRKGKMGWQEYGQAVKQNSAIVTQQLAMQTASINNVRQLQNGKFVANLTPNKDLLGISSIEMATARMNAFGEATKAAAQNTIDIGKNLAFSARQMSISLTMPMAIMGGLAIKQFADMDKQLTDIAKVYDTEADSIQRSTQQIKDSMKDLAMELSRTQGAQIEDTLNLAQYYAQMGKTGNELRESTIQASRLMKLGDVDINDAQKTITTLTAVVGANVDELGKYVDYLNKVEDSTQLTMQDFAKTLPTIAPLVKTFIPDDKDAQMMASANMMETARRAGFDPKESMNAWKSMYGSFVRPAGTTEDKYAALAAKYGEENTSLRELVSSKGADPIEILRELSKITKNWDREDRGELMTQITGKWQISRGLGFMQAMDAENPANRGAIDRMGKINDQLVNNPEQLADNSRRQMDLIRNSAHTQLQQLKQDVTMLFANLGETIFIPVMESLEKVMNFAKSIFTYMSQLPAPLKEAAKLVAQVTFVAGPILAALAAGRMLGGFGLKIGAGVVTKAAGAVRRGASMMGVDMKGSGRLEGRDETIANIQRKDSEILSTKMQAAIDLERKTQEKIEQALERKNAKTREAISLQKQLNKAISGTTSPVKDPETALTHYKETVKKKQDYPMAIKATDIGSQAFRGLVGQKGAPATGQVGRSMIPGTEDRGTIFPSLRPVQKTIGMAHATPYTEGQLGPEHKAVIQKEIDQINAGIAVRRSRGEKLKTELDAEIRALKASRPRNEKGHFIKDPARKGIDAKISELNKTYSRDGLIQGEKSYSIDSLEAQRAELVSALNGGYIKQAEAMSRITAAQNRTADAQENVAKNAALPHARRRDIVMKTKDAAMSTRLSFDGLMRGDTSLAKDQIDRGVFNLKSMWAKRNEQVRNDLRAIEEQKKRWSENTLRGGPQFRGSMTPKEVADTRGSKEWKKWRKDLYNDYGPDNMDLNAVVKGIEEKRKKLADEAEAAYLALNKGDTIGAAKAGQQALRESNLPTATAFTRLAEEENDRAIQRADALAARQEKITENSGRWASNISHAATGLGVVGGIATQVLGIQNNLLNTVLGVTAGIGAIGEFMPGVMQKVVTSFADAGANMLDWFDGTNLGTKMGNKLGDTMGTSMATKMSGAFSKIGASLMAFMPYLAGIAAAFVAAKFALDIIQKDSKEYLKTLEEMNRSTELHAELLGYVRKEQEKPIESMDFEEATAARAKLYAENEDGRSEFIRQMANVGGPAATQIKELDAILSQEAIKILDDGGSEADVRSMVVAALQAAGIDDPIVIDGVTDIYQNFRVNSNTVMSEGITDEMKENFSGEGTARSWWTQRTGPSMRMPDQSGRSPEEIEAYQLDVARSDPSEDAKIAADKWTTHLRGAFSQAQTEDVKAEIARKYIEVVTQGREMAEGDIEKMAANLAMSDKIFEGLLSSTGNPLAYDISMDNNYNPMKDNLIFQESVIGGTEQYDDAAEGVDRYKTALDQIQAVHGPLSDEQKRLLFNVIASAGGFDMLAHNAKVSEDVLSSFTSKTKDAKDELKDMTPQEYMKNLNSFEGGEAAQQLEQIAHQGKDVNEVLANTPGEFHKRWQFDIETNGEDGLQQFMGALRSAQQAGMDYALGEANRRMEAGHKAIMDRIQDETDAANDSLEASQKASEKAFEARSKALDAQFKAQSKDLQNKQKAEKKAFDKQQKEEDKAFNERQKMDQRNYDKSEKARQKDFSKSQERDRKAFEKSWDDRSDVINDYFDNAIKAIDEQGRAEERLDQLRERNAERERRRREYLAEMANTNIDINVAVAGGNLDEAARLANNATSSATQYYQDSLNAEENYASQDRGDARARQTESLNNRREGAMDEFGRQRENATEAFGEMQEGQAEGFEEELQRDRDLYEAKKALEAEQWAEQQALEAERLAEKQEAETERLQLEQERAREALALEREAMSERYAAERENIAETSKKKQEAAQLAIDEQRRALEGELQALKAWVPQNEAEMQEWIKTLEGIYDEHGIELGNFGSDIHNGMTKSMAQAMDEANNKIRTDQNWNRLGEQIGGDLKTGILKGIVGGPAAAAAALIFGTDVETPPPPVERHDPSYNDFARYANGPAKMPRRADGGPIVGPGTATSDSILARLSNGEHVFTAAEVNALGGHAAVERLRAAIRAGKLPAFATGGGVGASAGAASSDLNVRVSSTGAGTVADGGVLSAVASDVANLGTTFDETLSSTVAPAWQLFGDTMVAVKRDSIDPVLEGSKVALAEYAATTNQIMSANMNPAWVRFGENLKMVKNGVWDVVMTDMKAGLTTLSSSFATTISNEIMPKWTEGSNHVRTMQDTVIAPALQATRDATTQTAQNFGTAADMIGVGWGKVKENSAAPVRYTVGTVYNDGLVGMWNKVAEALDLDPMTPHEVSFATGGVMPGYTPGRDVHHFTSPTGGKLHLSGGEAIMRPEWTRAVGGPSAVAKMNSDAKSGKVQRFANGGVVDAPGGGRPKGKPKAKEDTKEPATPYGMPTGTNISYGAPGFPAWVYNMANQFGLMASTYPGHQENNVSYPGFMPNPQRQNRGIDWSGPIDKMHTFAQYLVANGPSMPQLEQVIWMHPGTGQKIGWYGNAPDFGGSIFAGDYGGHQDHVHTRQSQSLDGSGSMDGVILGLGGMGISVDPKIVAAVTEFNKEKNALKDKIKAHIEAGPDTVMKAIPGKIFSAFTAGMEKKISAAMPLMTGASIGAYGLNHEDHVREIIAAAHERGLPMEAARIAIATALVESELRMYANHAVPESLNFPHEAIGSDHDSVGLFQQRNNGAWGTVAQRMNARASAHLFYNRLQQFDWRSMAPGDAAQKVQVSAFPEKYATRMAEADALIKMVGGFDANAGGVGGDDDPLKDTRKKIGGNSDDWFDRGGRANGIGYMPKNTIAPERVLSPRQTAAFEKLVPAINRVASGGLQESDYMAKTTFDTSAAFNRMIERNSEAQFDFTKILEKITPVISQLTGHLKSQIVPGITGYANELIQLDTDAARIDKVANDVIGAIKGIQMPQINNDLQFTVGGNVYGDAQLRAMLEQWQRDTIRQVEMRQAAAQQAIGGK